MATATERVFPASPTTGRTPTALAAPWLFTGEDNLRLVIINSQPGVLVTLDGRRLGPDDLSPQPFVQTFAPSADRQPNTFDFGFGDGFLLNCSLIVTSGSPLVGQTYCMLQVIRGLSGSRLVLGCLLGGYITAMQHLAYPGSPIQSSTEGEPYIRYITGTVPAPGTDVAESVPAGARWELLSFLAQLTTNAAVANRQVRLRALAAGNVLWECLPNVVQPASIGGVYTFAGNMNSAAAAINFRLQQPLPSPNILASGTLILTVTDNIQAGDQWAAITLTTREWLEAA